MTYDFLQHYWWTIIALLGSLLVFLMFVQGANSMIFQLGKNDDERRLLINSTGRKWEFTFTTLVTFGGAFFASFPLFYSTSFGSAYWIWLNFSNMPNHQRSARAAPHWWSCGNVLHRIEFHSRKIQSNKRFPASNFPLG